MNDLMSLNASNVIVMSSVEIARICDKRHDNVMADIRKMLNELNIQSPEFSGAYNMTELF